MLILLFIKFLMVIILTELTTELVIKSEIFKPVRNIFFKLGDWFTQLFSCGYCFSLWAAAGIVFLTNTSYSLTENNWVNLGLTALVVWRLSNIFHNLIDKFTDKYYDVRYVNTPKE